MKTKQYTNKEISDLQDYMTLDTLAMVISALGESSASTAVEEVIKSCAIPFDLVLSNKDEYVGNIFLNSMFVNEAKTDWAWEENRK